LNAILILDRPKLDTDFYPLLDKDKPLSLLDTSLSANLLSQMYSLMNSYFSRDKIYVICTKDELDIVKQSLPDMPESNIWFEPFRISYTFSLLFANVMLDSFVSDSVAFCFPVNQHAVTNFMLKNWMLSVRDLAAKDMIVMPTVLMEKNASVCEYIDGGRTLTNIGGLDYIQVNRVCSQHNEAVHERHGWFKKKVYGKQGYLLNILCGNADNILSLYRSREAANAVASLRRLLSKEDFSWSMLEDFYNSNKDYTDFDIYTDCSSLVTVFLETALSDVSSWEHFISRFATDDSGNVMFGKIKYADCHNVICFNYDKDEEINIARLNNLIIVKKYGNITIRNI
jgi:mannose-1-phosphate guanylyltransferase